MNKAGGLVVDYIGIGDDLKASLAGYSAKDVDDAAFPLVIANRALREKHGVVGELFPRARLPPSRPAHCSRACGPVSAAFAAVTGDEGTKKRFLTE